MREGWEIKTIGDVCDIFDRKRKPISKRDREPGPYPYYGASCIQDYVSGYLFDGRYLLIGEDGAKWGPGDDTAYIVEGKFWVNNHAHIVKAKQGYLDDFLRYYIKHLDLNPIVAGAIIPKLTQEKLATLEVPIPSLPEQQRIVDILDREFAKIDALKANAEKSLQAAKDLFQETLHRYYSGKNALLGDVLNLRRGHDLTHSEMKDGSIPVAGSGGIIGYHSIATPISPCIAVGRSGSVGKVFVYETCWAHNTILYVDDFKGNNPYYLVYLLKSLNLTSYGGGSAVPTLNRNVLHPLPVGYTSNKKEQATIVACLDNLNDKCQTLQDNYQKTLALCDDLKQSLLRKAFNGEL